MKPIEIRNFFLNETLAERVQNTIGGGGEGRWGKKKKKNI